jgi:hypothetical protein
MNIHKYTRLTLLDRQEMWRLYQTRAWKVTQLAEHFRVSRPTIYAVLKRARVQEFAPRDSTNQRFRTVRYGLKRLAKVEQAVQDKLKRAARRYNKAYPGELVHFDTKRLPLLKGQSATQPREYLFVAIDDFSRELYADILPDKSQDSASHFLINNVLAQCPYQIEYAYSDLCPVGTTAKSTGVPTSTLLPWPAGRITSARNSPRLTGHKPTAKPRGSSAPSWKCGTTKSNLRIIPTDYCNCIDLLIITTPSSPIRR